MSLPQKKSFLHTAPAAALAAAAATAALTACSGVPEDPEDPGFNNPAVTGVLNGEITTLEGYGNAVEKENRRANRDGPRWNDGYTDEF